MTIANVVAKLDAALEGLEVHKPIALDDVIEVRRIVQEALPDFQVEAYHDHKNVTVGVGLDGVVLVKLDLRAV